MNGKVAEYVITENGNIDVLFSHPGANVAAQIFQ
jgi:hypothetical protein